MRLLDAQFQYIPSTSTDVASTWRRFGYRPTTHAERAARSRGKQQANGAVNVTRLHIVKRSSKRATPRVSVKT